jgi:hypothetical protein
VRSEPVDLGLACLLVGAEVEPSLDVDEPLDQLDALAAAARPEVPRGARPAVAAAGLRSVLSAFRGSADDYDDVRSSLLTRCCADAGACRCCCRCCGSRWPPGSTCPRGRWGCPGTSSSASATRTTRTCTSTRSAAVGCSAAATSRRWCSCPPVPACRPAQLRPVPPNDLLLRLLTNIRVLTARQPPSLDAARTRLWAVELSLLLPRHPLELRRERGELLVRLGDHVGGATELEDYALAAEDGDAEAAETARREARQARARLN